MPLNSSAQASSNSGYDQSPRAVSLGVVGAITGIFYLTVLQFVSQSKLSDVFSFVFLLAALPIIVGSIVAGSKPLTASNLLLGKIFIAAALTTVVALTLLQRPLSHLSQFPHLLDILPVVIGLAVTFAVRAYAGLARFPDAVEKRRRFSIRVERYLFVVFLFVLVLLSPYDPVKAIPSGMASYILIKPVFKCRRYMNVAIREIAIGCDVRKPTEGRG